MKTKTKDAEDLAGAAWMSYGDAARYSGLGRTKLTSLVTSGQIPAAKVGKAVRINRAGLDEYLHGCAYVGADQD